MLRETLLVRALFELADTLVEDFDVDLVTVVATRCVEVLDVAAAGVMLAAPNGELRVAGSSSERMRVLELFELQTDEGPGVDCYRTGTPMVSQGFSDAQGRWPTFAAGATGEGFISVHGPPMRLRGKTIGALDLFRTAEGTLGAADVVVGQALAEVATIAILQYRTVTGAQALNGQLGHALTSRIIIEQANGKISEACGLGMEQAFLRLRHHARSHHLRLSDLASDIATETINPASLDPLPPVSKPVLSPSQPRPPAAPTRET